MPKKNQLAWKIAEIASDNAKLNKDAIEMVINRIIDNASVAIASLNRRPVISSREMALRHSRKNGATLFGVDSKLKFDCEWAAAHSQSNFNLLSTPNSVAPFFLECLNAISLDEITGLLFRDAIATEALSIILLITISMASLFNFALSLAISAIFHAS